ncbi:hypothetical protein [Cupriavidus pauculus]|uniref:hypothetical protein n=1 Tax=Cupriavidus pauculus TaxID=82633 RepID=UPI0038578902
MKKLLFILAAPALARAELIVLDPKVTAPRAAAAAVAAPAPAPAQKPFAPIVMSTTMQMTAMREGNALVLLFREAPTTLFVADASTGNSVTEVEWLSEKSLRFPAGDSRRFEIKTRDGRALLKLDASGVALDGDTPNAV